MGQGRLCGTELDFCSLGPLLHNSAVRLFITPLQDMCLSGLEQLVVRLWLCSQRRHLCMVARSGGAGAVSVRPQTTVENRCSQLTGDPGGCSCHSNGSSSQNLKARSWGAASQQTSGELRDKHSSWVQHHWVGRKDQHWEANLPSHLLQPNRLYKTSPYLFVSYR